jgi:hypothetical protein
LIAPHFRNPGPPANPRVGDKRKRCDTLQNSRGKFLSCL